MGTLLRLFRLVRLGYWSQQSRGHTDSAKAAKPTWDGRVSAQALILQEDLCYSCLFVPVSTLLENFQEGLEAGSFSLSAPSKGSPAVCLSMRGISDTLQRTFFWVLVNPNCHPKTFLSSSSTTSFRARVLFQLQPPVISFFIYTSILHLSWNHISLSLPPFHWFILLLLLASLCIYSICVVKCFQIQA